MSEVATYGHQGVRQDGAGRRRHGSWLKLRSLPALAKEAQSRPGLALYCRPTQVWALHVQHVLPLNKGRVRLFRS
jgi:hypothetical protein